MNIEQACRRLAKRAGIAWADLAYDDPVADLHAATIADARAWLRDNQEPLSFTLNTDERDIDALITNDAALAAMVYAAQDRWRELTPHDAISRCPDCGARGPHNDNGAAGAALAFCCRACGMHFDAVRGG